MEPILISVVLPVYNVAAYLERCIESVVNQTYQNLEIFLIDDGSTDESQEICRKWAGKDHRIRHIRKENQGLGMARNTGMEYAAGKYICFFDSDDYVALDTLEQCCALAQREQADVVCFGFHRVSKTGQILQTRTPCLEHLTYQGEAVREEFLPELIAPDTAEGKDSGLWMSAWTALYRLELLQTSGWQFASERVVLSEDLYSLLRLYGFVQKVAVLPKALYYYCENETSLSRTFRPDRYARIKDCYDACMAVCQELGYSEKVRRRLAYPYLSNTVAAAKQISQSRLSWREKRRYLEAMIRDSHLRQVLAGAEVGRDTRSRKVLFFLFSKGWVLPCMLLLVGKAYAAAAICRGMNFSLFTGNCNARGKIGAY